MAASNDKQSFSGTWVIDQKRSQSIDEVLKAQGIGLLKRKAADNMKITQKITIAADGASMTTEVTSALRNKTETIKLDGSVEKKESDELGPVDQKAFWREANGEVHLVVEVESNNEGSKGQTSIVRRVIEDGKVLEQQVSFKGKDGKEVTAKRYFNRS